MPTVLLGGGTGLIGSRLSAILTKHGYEVIHLSRSKRPNSEYPTFQWDVEQGTIDDEAVTRADYVINLAGAGIADKPWTSARKKIIIDSRVHSTQLLMEAFERTGHTPKAYLSSSAIGYYGDRGEEHLSETDSPGSGFLSESTMAWENSVKKIADKGIRTVIVRTGIVLSTKGGALEKMILPMKFGMATYFGNGRQWYSWIHLDDICAIFRFLMEKESASGIYNGVAPNPARNKELVQALKAAYPGGSILLPAPSFALKLALGEMSHAVLDSSRVSAEKIENQGYEFMYPELRPALDDLIQAG
jgi:hypothetical protein